MLLKNRVFFLIPICILIAISCKPKSVPETEPIMQVEEPISEAFWTFYETFHTDSIFQIEHTQWPLQGLPSSEDQLPISGSFTWQKEDWVTHHLFDDMNGTFEQKFTKMGHLILEKISDKSGTFQMEKRYANLGDGWMLIYYAGMRMVK